MLAHLTKTLHPGVLNDCFYQPATAVCAKRTKTAQPLPLLNTCAACPNARRSAIHLPQLTTARDQALQILDMPTKGQPIMPPLQRTALTEYTATLDQLIAEITDAAIPDRQPA